MIHNPLFNSSRSGISVWQLMLPLLAVGMLVFAVMFSSLTDEKPAPPPPDATPPVSVYEHEVAGVGVTEPASENISIGTNLPGIVTEVAVASGEKVRKGDLLFAIDAREAKARLDIAQIEAAEANEQLARYQSVRDKRAISRDELSRRLYAAKRANSRVKEIQIELDRLKVYAPISGTILQLNIRQGEYANTNTSNTPLIVMGDISTMHVRVEVDEADALKIKPQAEAAGMLRGYADTKIPLRFVRKEYLVTPKRTLTGDGNERVDTRVQEIIFAFDNIDIGAFVGQQMDVFIQVPQPEQKARRKK